MGFPLPVNRSFWLEFISRSVWQPLTAFPSPSPSQPSPGWGPAQSPHTHQPPQDSYSFCFSKATSLLANHSSSHWGFQLCTTGITCSRPPHTKALMHGVFWGAIWAPPGHMDKGRPAQSREMSLCGIWPRDDQCSLPTKGIGNSGVSECGVFYTIPWHLLSWHLFTNA